MKEVSIVAFEAWDGKKFDTAQKCKDYEAGALHLRLANLPPEKIKAALDRTDIDLADALEDAGMLIRELRRKNGDLRRKPSSKEAAGAP